MLADLSTLLDSATAKAATERDVLASMCHMRFAHHASGRKAEATVNRYFAYQISCNLAFNKLPFLFDIQMLWLLVEPI